ncbi:MAG: hypothetical protein K5868_05965 [Lachnospiraceae bacterium]|nr:hypothetical protein [Lachnospiraceae bacterium]
MNSEIKMNVSSLIRKDGDKAIYVMFTDGDKEAEFIVPECRLLNNKGFTDEEIGNLIEYIKNEQDYIYNIAKKVNPIKGFMGRQQGV